MPLLHSKALWLPIALTLSLGALACSSSNTPVGGELDAGTFDATQTPDAEALDAEVPDAEIPDVCGDGIVGNTEICDDSEEVDGDGCAADCQMVESGYACAGEPSVCVPVCGDGQTIAPEECDDTNTSSADGCSDTCIIESGFICPTEGAACIELDGSCALPLNVALVDNAGVLEGSFSGTTLGGTNDVPPAACDGDVSGSGNDLVYAFTLPDERDVTISAAFAVDGLFRVLSAPCDPTTRVPGEIGFGDSCADQGGPAAAETLTLLNVAAGTYFIAVDGVTDTDNGAFSITLSAAATTCGDGVVTGIEECDDPNDIVGDGCSHCALDPQFRCIGTPSVCTTTCQDGIVDVDQLEECDDGNDVNGDRCSDGCLMEFDVLDAEPNNTIAEAQTVISGDTILGAAPIGDFDIYELVLADEAWITLEGYTTVDGDDSNYAGSGQLGPVVDCNFAPNEIDMDLHLFGAAGDVTDVTTALLSDDFAGVELCPFIGVNVAGVATRLSAGTYYIRVDAFDETLNIVQYAVDIRTDAVLDDGDVCDDAYDHCLAPSFACNTSTLICEELCGNGLVEPLEECDDGNAVDTDRCSDSCLINADVTDIAGNDSFATAQLISSGEIARGSLDPEGTDEFDLYTFTLSTTAFVVMETYTTVDGDIANYTGEGLDATLDCGNDTEIHLFDASGDPTDNATALVRDDDDGDELCSYLGPNRDGTIVELAPGTYFIKVNEFDNNAAIPLYALDFQVETLLEFGDTCDIDFDLCDPQQLVCDPVESTCVFLVPAPIDRTNFELFSGDFDLQNTQLVFTPGGGSYGVVATSTPSYPDTPGSGTEAAFTLVLGDDSNVEVPITSFPFPFFGVNESSVFVGSNGYITFGVGDLERLETTTSHFDAPRISFFFDDLDPTEGGSITADEFTDHLTITFDNVRVFGLGSTEIIQVQVQLFDDGVIVITYLTVEESDCLVGISAGDNEANPPAEIDFSAQIAVAPGSGDLVINEFLANGTGADTNCDGAIDSTDDEFVELVNISGVPLSLGGLTLADGNSVRHVFTARTLAHGQAIVVYGAGVSNCPDVLGTIASSGSLGLNNTGDTITLSTGDTISYTGSNAGISRTLHFDLEGPGFVDHDVAGGATSDFSPGFRATGAAF